ncbi:MAG: hypothetical protein HUJ98_09385, partial [Bacteroidaceae bacterium]|nr:hypothetical protein [Bacteroidaceae bacterium]
GISGAFTSCKNDAPDIVVKSQTTYTSDFKGIANAINDQSVAIEEKLNLLNTALGDVNLTLDQKLDLIEQAIQNGVTTYKECAKNLIDAINKLQLTQEAKLQAIYDILKSSNATLAQKLADIEAAIKAGIGSYELCAQALIDQINALNVSRADKLQAIYDVLKSSFATLEAKVELVKLAIANGFITNADAINALNEAIVAQLKYNKEDLAGSIDDITKSIVLVKGSIDAGFVLTNTTMNVAVQALCVGLTTANWTVNASLRAVEAAIKLLSLNVTLDSTKILKQLELIKEAILKGNDYSGIIAAIKSLLPQPEREAVDLGLSVDWATCNLGAEKPEEFGDYYGFGMITPYAPDEGSGWKQYWEALGVQGAT